MYIALMRLLDNQTVGILLSELLIVGEVKFS